MRKILLIVSLLVVFSATPVLAITDGALDGNDHPNVGLMVAIDKDGNPLWRCSGTLISPVLYITAGHCTEAPAVTAEIWFAADVDGGMPGNGYPTSDEYSGKAYTHPKYDPNAFWRYDLGMVQLDTPVVGIETASIPTKNQLDQYKTKRGKRKLWFTAVGYGLQKSFPDAAGWKTVAKRIRMVAYPKLIQINGGIAGRESLLLSDNTATGGTCFGDSGGPNFIKGKNVIGGITSFGMNGTCAGTGGVYRIDRADDLAFINSFPR
jgi:hypothetical protein